MNCTRLAGLFPPSAKEQLQIPSVVQYAPENSSITCVEREIWSSSNGELKREVVYF